MCTWDTWTELQIQNHVHSNYLGTKEMAIFETKINKASQMNEIAHLWKSFQEETIWMSVPDKIRELLFSQPGT